MYKKRRVFGTILPVSPRTMFAESTKLSQTPVSKRLLYFVSISKPNFLSLFAFNLFVKIINVQSTVVIFSNLMLMTVIITFKLKNNPNEY